ncbi:GTP binding protein [Spraguea lophii 42_110]|uniref:GTP binding protein n=1 Tax=Spraguea lophii (strain 42_110) TaxID=1358809 RepID=S7W6M5_SPRLO|nr:GTP binding protein [Spraguea lophii 42_110]
MANTYNFRDEIYKIVLVGDGGTGKTTFVQRVKSGCFIREYIATIGAEVSKIEFYTNDGRRIIFDVWDTAGQEVNAVLNDVYYLEAKGAIIMFDVTSRITHKNVNNWLARLNAITTGEHEKIPIILCGNKVDIKDRKVKYANIIGTLPQDIYKYVDISAKSNYNFELPFLFLARKLTGNPHLEFISNLNLMPAEVQITPEHMQQLMEEERDAMTKAQQMELPDDDF